LQEDILTFLHFFLESPSLRPGKTNKPGRKLCRAVSDSSSLTWEWAFQLPQDGCFPQKQPSEPEFQDKAYLHRIRKTR